MPSGFSFTTSRSPFWYSGFATSPRKRVRQLVGRVAHVGAARRAAADDGGAGGELPGAEAVRGLTHAIGPGGLGVAGAEHADSVAREQPEVVALVHPDRSAPPGCGSRPSSSSAVRPARGPRPGSFRRRAARPRRWGFRRRSRRRYQRRRIQRRPASGWPASSTTSSGGGGGSPVLLQPNSSVEQMTASQERGMRHPRVGQRKGRAFSRDRESAALVRAPRRARPTVQSARWPDHFQTRHNQVVRRPGHVNSPLN